MSKLLLQFGNTRMEVEGTDELVTREPYRLDCGLMKSKVEEACRVAVEAMREQAPQWVSIEERLPEENTRVLTADGSGNIHIFSHSKAMRFPFNIGPDHPRYYPVTHWMPLPPLPEVER